MQSVSDIFTSIRAVHPETIDDLFRSAGSALVAFVHPWPPDAESECGVRRIVRLERCKLGADFAWYFKVAGDVRLHTFDPEKHGILVLESVDAAGA